MRGQIENQEHKIFFLLKAIHNTAFLLHYSKIGRKRKISQAELAHDPLLI